MDNIIEDVKNLDKLDIPKVSLVLLQSNGKILAVSRKNDPTDFGLVGGKCDKNETLERAAIREVKEETGLDIFNLVPIYIGLDGIYTCVTFKADAKNFNINTTECGVVAWVDFDVLNKGSFGKYNREVEKIIFKSNLFPYFC